MSHPPLLPYVQNLIHLSARQFETCARVEVPPDDGAILGSAVDAALVGGDGDTCGREPRPSEHPRRSEGMASQTAGDLRVPLSRLLGGGGGGSGASVAKGERRASEV